MTDDNWIKYTSGKCPVPYNTVVDVETRTSASHVNWDAVTRYRIYEPPIVAELRKKLKIATDTLQEISYSDAFVGDYCHLDDSVNKALEQIAELEGTK